MGSWCAAHENGKSTTPSGFSLIGNWRRHGIPNQGPSEVINQHQFRVLGDGDAGWRALKRLTLLDWFRPAWISDESPAKGNGPDPCLRRNSVTASCTSEKRAGLETITRTGVLE